MPTPTRLTLRLFGGVEIQAAAAPLDLRHQKARALLCYLAATGQPHTRTHLTTLLWSESPDREARHSLRTSLYRLRQALRAGGAEAALVASGDTLFLRLDAARDDCDVLRFRQLLSAGSEAALGEAAGLYRGPLLQGLALSGAPVFEEWLQAADAQLGQAYGAALERLAALAEARADWAAVLRWARPLVLFDPWSEPGQRRLMAGLLQQGEVSAALRQYQQYEARLRRELGAAPPPEIQALAQSAVRPAGLSGPARAAPAQPQALPFVGRDDVLSQLLDLSQAPALGRGAVALVQGEGGLGKSRLLDELGDRLAAAPAGPRPWTALRGTCSPFDQLLSYGPFIEALGGLAADEAPAAEATTPDAQGQFFWRVLQTLRALAQTGPVLLALDDLQWANSSTLNLFGFLASRLADAPVLLMGTVQRAEAVPALQRLITLGRRRGTLQLFSLDPLSRAAVAQLLEAARVTDGAAGIPLGGRDLAAWLHERSGGNPFLLREILAQLRADGILQAAESEWRLDPTRWLRWRASFVLPETTYDLVTWRLANLAPQARQLLEALAVAGQPLAHELLRDWLELPAAQLLALVEDLLSRGLVVETAGGLALPHNLLREALLHRLSQMRRRALHLTLAARLEACPALARNVPLWQIALHAVAGEDEDRARRYGLRVLADLPQHYTGAETVEFLQHLHELLAPSGRPDELLPLTRALGQAHQALGHLPAARRWLQANLDLARQAGDLRAQAAALFELSELALVSNDFQAAAAAAEGGLAAFGERQAGRPVDAAGGRARGQRLLGAALAMEGRDLAAAEQHLQAAVDAHRQLGAHQQVGAHLTVRGPRELAATLFELGNVAAQRGQVARALALYEEAAAAAQTGRVHYYQALAHNNYAYHSLLLGRPAAAQAAAAQGLKLAEMYEMLGVLLFLYGTQGEIHLYLAEWAAAAQAFERGLAVAEELGNLERQAGYRAGLALAARGQGEAPARVILRLEEALAPLSGQGYWHLQTRLLLWLAEALAEAGRAADAWARLRQALGTSESQGRAILRVQGQRLRARLLAAEGDWPAARATLAEALERAAQLGLPLEVARTQAAWGALGLRAGAPEAPQRLAQARAAFTACDAQADLAGLPRMSFDQ